MGKNIVKVLFGIFIFVSVSNVWADDSSIKVEGIIFNSTVKVAGKTLVLNGAGKRVKLFHDVYAMGLYVPKKSTSPDDLIQMDGPKLIEIHMLRNVDAKTFVEALKDGLEDNNADDTLSKLKPQITQLESIMLQTKQASKGNTIKLEFNPSGGTQVYMNGKKLGSQIGAGANFYSALLRVWLGKDSVDGDLKISLEG